MLFFLQSTVHSPNIIHFPKQFTAKCIHPVKSLSHHYDQQSRTTKKGLYHSTNQSRLSYTTTTLLTPLTGSSPATSPFPQSPPPESLTHTPIHHSHTTHHPRTPALHLRLRAKKPDTSLKTKPKTPLSVDTETPGLKTTTNVD